MRRLAKLFAGAGLALIMAALSGCDDPQVYGSVGVSSGWGGGGWGRSGVHTSISVGGRIR